MSRKHQGKTAVISGAASGIGQASAVRLAEEGAQIVIADRAKADDTLQRIKAAGGSATAGYRTAASEMSPAILQAVQELISGEPLDATAEAAARSKDWNSAR